MNVAEQKARLIQDLYDVYQKGKADGMLQGENTQAAYNQGVTDGKQAEIVSFANMIQKDGTRTDYRYLFYKSGLDDTTFNDIFSHWNSTIKNANYMFVYTNIIDSAYTDNLDFSECETLLSTFQDCSTLRKLKVIDARKTISGHNGMANIFLNCRQLERIEEFYPSAGESKTTFNKTFENCSALTHIKFMSEISQNGLNLSWSNLLDKESIESVIENLSSTTSGLSITLPLLAIQSNFEGGFFGQEFTELKNTKPNWEIVYG